MFKSRVSSYKKNAIEALKKMETRRARGKLVVKMEQILMYE